MNKYSARLMKPLFLVALAAVNLFAGRESAHEVPHVEDAPHAEPDTRAIYERRPGPSCEAYEKIDCPQGGAPYTLTVRRDDAGAPIVVVVRAARAER